MSGQTLGGGLRRRPERAEDEAFRRSLYADVAGPLFVGIDDETRAMLLRQQFAAQTASYRVAHPNARFDIVEVEGVPVGRVVTAVTPGAMIVVDLAIAMARRRQGIATRLLRAIGREAAASGKPTRLRVATGNAEARRLYERLGFVAVTVSELDISMEWVPASRRPKAALEGEP